MRTFIEIYVGDHLAASAAGHAFARRAQHNNRDTPLGRDLERIATEIGEDARTLGQIARQLAIRRSWVKHVGGLVGERVARLKANGRLVRYSPLSRVFELEGLMAAIDMKRSLWESLAESSHAPELAHFDLAVLTERAAAQRETLAIHHRAAAGEAFGRVG